MDPENEMRAMVLCAGYGTRLEELTREVPKPMLRLNGRPMLEYILVNLKRHGFDQIAINLHFMPEAIRAYFGDGSRWRLALTYSHETELMGTAGGVKRMQDFLRRGDAFLVHYGDVITDQDLTALLRFHEQRRASITLLVHERKKSNSVVVLGNQNQVVRFLERPADSERIAVESIWVNSGVCICSPEVLDAIPSGVACDLPRDVFPKLITGGRMFGFPLSGYRCAIDSPDRLEEAQAALAEGRCAIDALESVNRS
jgi:mannose-1-phosphate guanylyltransferase/phosphomannomutase